MELLTGDSCKMSYISQKFHFSAYRFIRSKLSFNLLSCKRVLSVRFHRGSRLLSPCCSRRGGSATVRPSRLQDRRSVPADALGQSVSCRMMTRSDRKFNEPMPRCNKDSDSFDLTVSRPQWAQLSWHNFLETS